MNYKKARKVALILAVLAFIAILFSFFHKAFEILSALLLFSSFVVDVGYYKCPHCNKNLHRNNGDYCQHCGKKLGD